MQDAETKVLYATIALIEVKLYSDIGEPYLGIICVLSSYTVRKPESGQRQSQRGGAG